VKLVYFGTSEFAVPALIALSGSVALVVSQPDRPAGRGRNLRSSPVKMKAADLGLPVATPERASDPAFIDTIRAIRPDALVVASYGQILKESLLECAVRGGINLHASLLPKYRGAAPVQRAILAGESETGVCVMQMDKGMDTGDVIDSRATAIGADETAGELEARLAAIAADLAAEWLPQISAGSYPREPQSAAAATMAPKMTPQDGLIDVRDGASDAYRRFRACTPRPGCWIASSAGLVRVIEARLASDVAEPGTVAAVDSGSITLALSGGALRLLRVQPQGRSGQSAREYANGRRMSVGDRF
jgi:methionyl-tRNA formyltransferase